MKFLERLRMFLSGNNRVCPKHGPFRFPPGCRDCQAYFWREFDKGREPFEIIFGPESKVDEL